GYAVDARAPPGWMGVRFVGGGAGARYGVSGAIAGVLVAQVIGSATVVAVGVAGFRRFPSAEPEPLGDERREIFHFIWQSSAATGTIALRQWLAPLFLLGVSTPAPVGFYKVPQAPQAPVQ